MRLRLNVFFFGLVLLGLALGCGNSDSSAAAGTTTNTTTNTTTGAARNPAARLQLTTFRHIPAEREIIAEFERRFGAKVEVNVLSAGEMLLRARDGKLSGDVFITPTLEDITRLHAFEMLQPFYVDIFSQGNVDDGFMDVEGYYAGLTRWTMAAVYDIQQVAVGEVETYKALAKLPSRGIKIGLAHPDSSGLAGVVSGLYGIVNDQAAQLWTKIIYENQGFPPGGNDWDQLERLVRGEVQVAFVSNSAAIRWFLNGDPDHFEAGNRFRMKYPRTETDNVNFFNMTCIGMRANTPNRLLAMRFINHLYRKENQEKLGEATFEYPTEAFSEASSYLLGQPDNIGRRVPANVIEERLPLAWNLINRIGSGNK